MNSSFLKMKKLLSLLLVVITVISVFTVTVSAEREQDMVLMSIHSSNINPEAGETITVTVKIDNYVSMRPFITAMHVGVLFDDSLFDYVQGSAKSELVTYSGDAVSVAFDNENTVELVYTYANASNQPLNRNEDMKLFSFQLKTKSSIDSDSNATFSITEDTFYSHDAEYKKIGVREPIIDQLTVWAERPVILMNSSQVNKKEYDRDVELQFPSTAQLIYNNREPVTITSPYTCSLNGTYMVMVNSGGVEYSQTFTVAKTIRNIGVKTSSLPKEYAIGIEPDYSQGKLYITYTDNTSVEIPMSDPDVKITGFDKNKAGTQVLKIDYLGLTTTYTVEVIDKKVEDVVLQSPVDKKDYLVGDDIDPTGGFLFVIYDDGSHQQVPLSLEMLSGFDKMEAGEKSVTVTYGDKRIEDAFKVNYFLRNKVDALISEIEALVIEDLTLNDYDKIIGLKSDYDKLTDLERAAVTNYAKLNEAIEKINSDIPGGTVDPSANTSPSTQPSSQQGNPGGISVFKIIIYILAIIIAISVISGGTYFLVMYFKRKRDDKTEFYYTEEEDVDGDMDSDEDVYDDEEDEIEDIDEIEEIEGEDDDEI